MKRTTTKFLSVFLILALLSGQLSGSVFASDKEIRSQYGTLEYFSKASENGLTMGTDSTHFSLDRTVSRAESVTFLFRLAGTKIDNENPFADVENDAYYTDAVLWAAACGITTGRTETSFAPKSDCTRAEIVTFLYRAFGQP